jgi:ABC-type nitrate/sulfonate/bicarbonate transport system permease component
VLLFLWQVATLVVHSPFFPSPLDVAKAFVTIATIGDIEHITLLAHSEASIFRVLVGFGLACITGIPLGIAIGLRPGIYGWTRSVIEPIRFIPPIAWIPLAIILLTGFSRYMLIIWLGSFFPVLLNTIAGVKRTNPTLVEVARVLGADKKSTILKVMWPSALPEIAAGMRIGLGVGWMCIMAAEMIGGERVGLGRLILKYAELLRVDVIFVGMITIGIIGLLMNEVFIWTEKRIFRWRVEVRI